MLSGHAAVTKRRPAHPCPAASTQPHPPSCARPTAPAHLHPRTCRSLLLPLVAAQLQRGVLGGATQAGPRGRTHCTQAEPAVAEGAGGGGQPGVRLGLPAGGGGGRSRAQRVFLPGPPLGGEALPQNRSCCAEEHPCHRALRPWLAAPAAPALDPQTTRSSHRVCSSRSRCATRMASPTSGTWKAATTAGPREAGGGRGDLQASGLPSEGSRRKGRRGGSLVILPRARPQRTIMPKPAQPRTAPLAGQHTAAHLLLGSTRLRPVLPSPLARPCGPRLSPLP